MSGLRFLSKVQPISKQLTNLGSLIQVVHIRLSKLVNILLVDPENENEAQMGLRRTQMADFVLMTSHSSRACDYA